VPDRSSSGSPPAVDLDALQADPAMVDHLDIDQLADVLERYRQQHDRMSLVERRVHARLRQILGQLARGGSPLITAAQAGKRLGVSADYIRDHGEALGIAVPLDGVIRYDPVAIEALRLARRPR
jgi:hypothetical protein